MDKGGAVNFSSLDKPPRGCVLRQCRAAYFFSAWNYFRRALRFSRLNPTSCYSWRDPAKALTIAGTSRSLYPMHTTHPFARRKSLRTWCQATVMPKKFNKPLKNPIARQLSLSFPPLPQSLFVLILRGGRAWAGGVWSGFEKFLGDAAG